MTATSSAQTYLSDHPRHELNVKLGTNEWDFDTYREPTFTAECAACGGSIIIACEWQSADYEVNCWPGWICGPHADKPSPCVCGRDVFAMGDIVADYLTRAEWF